MDEPYVHRIFIDNIERKQDEKIWLGKSGFTNDRTVTNEKSLDTAVMAYPIKHYTYWNEEIEGNVMKMGEVGENLSVLEMDEYHVYIGDTIKIGDAIIQVSEPGPLEKLPSPKSLRTGWYYRVIQEGLVVAGVDMELIERPHPEWSIAACNEVMHVYQDDLRAADELAICDLLSDRWRRTLRKRLRGF